MIRDLITTPFLALVTALLFFTGSVGFATGSLVSAWDERANHVPAFIPMHEIAKEYAFRGTFGADL